MAKVICRTHQPECTGVVAGTARFPHQSSLEDGQAVGRLFCILRGDSLELLTLLLGFLFFFFFPVVGESFKMEEERNYCSNVVRLS